MAKKKNTAAKKEGSSLKIHRPKNTVKKVMYVVKSVPDQYVFYLCDGKVLRNLNDLINSLDKMVDDVFNFHANKDKNDFSNWIRDVISEPELSMNIIGKNKHGTKYEIMRFLKKRGAI